HNGAYQQAPDWFRNFQYDVERARGLDYGEDLASPGILHWNLSEEEAVCLLSAQMNGAAALPASETAVAHCAQIRAAEQQRRRLPARLQRAADAYLVQRGQGKTIVAGYPWFTDWGRDTFIALRGLCLPTGRLDDARSILLQWAEMVSEGMLPNRCPDQGEAL